MFRLGNIGLVNWYLLDIADIEISGNAGIIGENRSGKSALLDLVQTVMTGNNGNILRLNASANPEGRRRNARSVRDYCLGRYGGADTMPRRRDALTYLVLAFASEETGQTLSLGLALSARLEDKREDTISRFIAPGLLLKAEDFVEETADGLLPRVWPVMRSRLEKRCAEAGTSLIEHGAAEMFVADYLKLMSSGGRPMPAKQFLRAFVNAVSFETIDSATRFVRDFILEDRPIQIGHLRDAIRTYRELDGTIRRLKSQLYDLKELEKLVERHDKLMADELLNRWLAARADLEAARRALGERRRHRDNNRAIAERAKALVERAAAELARLDKERGEIKDMIAQSGLANRLLLNELQLKDASAEAEKALAPIKALYEAIKRAAAILGGISAGSRDGTPPPRDALPLPPNFASLLDTLRQLHREGGASTPPQWPENPNKIQQLLAALTTLPALRGYLSGQADACIKEHGRLGDRIAEAEGLLRTIRERGVAITSQTERLFVDLERLGMKPRLLCSLVEVADDHWRDAVEALLGRNREAILVAPDHVTAAITHMSHDRARFQGCLIVNTRKLDPQDTTIPPESLAAILTISDPWARAFIKYRIGNVRRAETVEALHRPGRAIMSDGTYDDGIAVEVLTIRHGYKLGATVSQRTSASLEAEIAAARREQARLQAGAAHCRRLDDGLRALDELRASTSILDLVDAYERHDQKLRQLKEERSQIEKNIDPRFEQQLAEIDSQIAGYRKDKGEDEERLHKAETQIAIANDTLGKGDAIEGSLLHCQAAYRVFLARKPLFAADKAKAALRDRLRQHRGSFRTTAQEAHTIADDAKVILVKAHGNVFDALIRYEGLWNESLGFSRNESSISGEVRPWVEQQIDLIENNRLITYAKEAERAAEEMRNVFQSAFITELQSRFDGVRTDIDRLNGILRPHRFHHEQYEFIRKRNPEYDAIISLVEEARSNPSILLPLFGQAAVRGSPHAAAIARVQELLLDEETDIAAFEDYRQYFVFDLRMTDHKTQTDTNLEHRSGVGSGAEKQVPFYVAIGAALAAAYHGQAARKDGIRRGVGLALFDEAFSKMDGRNQAAMLEFYKQLGLQSLIAAPYDKRSLFLEMMDTIVEIYRDGTRVEIDVEHLKSLTREAVRDENPAYLALDDIRALLSREKAAE